MNALTDEPLLDLGRVEREVVARDREIDNPFTKDLQVTAIHGARRYLADRVTRVAAPHQLLDPEGRPADRRQAAHPHPQDARRAPDRPRRPRAAAGRRAAAGLYAAGEVAGFGGGGMHGYRALEGTFLGGCIFSGRGGPRGGVRGRLSAATRRYGEHCTLRVVADAGPRWAARLASVALVLHAARRRGRPSPHFRFAQKRDRIEVVDRSRTADAGRARRAYSMT